MFGTQKKFCDHDGYETSVPSKTGALGPLLKELLPKLSPASEMPAPGIKVFPLASLPHHSLSAVGGGGSEDWLLKALLADPIVPLPAAPAAERCNSFVLKFKPGAKKLVLPTVALELLKPRELPVLPAVPPVASRRCVPASGPLPPGGATDAEDSHPSPY